MPLSPVASVLPPSNPPHLPMHPLPANTVSTWASSLCMSCTHCSRVFASSSISASSRAFRAVKPGREYKLARGFSTRSGSVRAEAASAPGSSSRSTGNGGGGEGAKKDFPFPSRKNPSPHEIFHLPRGATEADIKARYFDLVRLYHPDKASDLPPDAAHARFRSITSAYDILRGKTASGSSDDVGVDTNGNPHTDLRYQTTAAWRAAHRKRQQELYSTGAADEKWKDRIILFGVVSTIVFVIANTFTTRKEALTEALNRTRQMNESRHQHFQDQHELLKKQQQQARMEEESRLAADS